METNRKDILSRELQTTLDKIKELLKNKEWDLKNSEHKEVWDRMVDKAHELHKLVKPTHHKYMIENRGYEPDDKQFYSHIHPVEDLLKFITDPTANDDPKDNTIDHEFELEVYTRRQKSTDKYHIKRTLSGWYIENIAIFGNCDKSGKPFLFENLNQDSVNYPEALPEYMEFLWQEASERGMSHDAVQQSLKEISKWLKACEVSSPKGIWESYK